ncbi:MAG: MBL fold metallo-hydrolase [Spirochaetota bacterium]
MISSLKNGFSVASMPLGPIDTNCHILYQGSQALIIDAPLDSLSAIRNFLEERKLDPLALLLTHGHWDHMGGAAVLAQTLGLPVWANRNDLLMFESPQIMRAYAGDWELKPVNIDYFLDFADSNAPFIPITIGEFQAEAYAMPGHTPGGVAYYFPQADCVMTGDQLFRDSVGRSDFPGGNFELLAASIRKSLYQLPGETVVFPGHRNTTTIRREMECNPFVPA